MNKRIYQILGITCFIHIIIFICLYGTKCLNVSYTDWMMDEGDLGVEYFGSLFFARSDWNFPIGLMEGLSSGIQSLVYYDALPVLAILGKLLRGILPYKFQLWGIYSLLVFCMQGGLGACCVYKFIKSRYACIAGSFLFSMQVIFLSNVFVQIPLSSHWILLCTFLIALYYEQLATLKRAWCIAGILALTMFVQTAFLPMVLCVLFFRMLAEVGIKHSRKALIENIALMLTGIVSIGISAWLLGLFNVSTAVSGGGLGNAAIRLDSFINPMGASLLLSARSAYKITEATSFAYLGVGVMILFCIAAVVFAVKVVQQRGRCISRSDKIYLGCAFLAMGISIFFALSPIAKWGNKVIYEIPLNETFYKIWSMVRSSYRLAWPVVYGVVILAVWALSKVRFKWKNVVLVICALIQIVDMIPVLRAQCAKFEVEVKYESPLVSNAWEELAKNRNKIIFMNGDCRNNAMSLIQVMERPAIYGFAYYAYENGMTMNDFYYARKDSETMNKVRTDIWNDLYKGKADEQAIYIFLETPARLIFEETLNFYWVDGYFIGITDELGETLEAVKYHAGDPVSILPLSEKTLLYAEKAEYDGDGGRIIHSEGSSWGPQISLDPGRYRISIVGENLESAEIECVSRGDNRILMENVQILDELIEYEIQLDDVTTKIDFIVANPAENDIVLKDMTIVQCNK